MDESGKSNNQQVRNKIVNTVMKTIMSFIGIMILSLGAAFLREGRVGLDPFTAMNTGLSARFNMSLGTFQLGVNLIIFVFIVILDRKKIGIGTILNMVLVGYEIEWFSQLYQHFYSGSVTPLVIVADLVIGLLLFTFGTSIYMTPSLGVAPYDAIAPIASARLHIKYKIARMIQDILFLVAAVLASGPVGIATIIVAFFAGPLITYWNGRVSKKLVQSIDHFSEKPSMKQVGHGLVAFGQVSYRYVSNVYNETFHVQLHLSDYSDAELESELKNVKRNMNDSEKLYLDYKEQYDLLSKENIKRQENEK
ncbi:membrane protein [Companilactobacillus allii]|uniref:Membrane protein n=1 Tax=Companilactobacillus allii TaxID=1847728 RepID=A0A1P8Q0Y3_9LACO|nr:membrane protein [Companilactobacillus allii]APX71496.1 membrane protein [Companilactobacillus allii]USQ68577.1 membrane protein [Companilactobacillus allii]